LEKGRWLHSGGEGRGQKKNKKKKDIDPLFGRIAKRDESRGRAGPWGVRKKECGQA